MLLTFLIIKTKKYLKPLNKYLLIEQEQVLTVKNSKSMLYFRFKIQLKLLIIQKKINSKRHIILILSELGQ